jgi:hypothetical protein
VLLGAGLAATGNGGSLIPTELAPLLAALTPVTAAQSKATASIARINTPRATERDSRNAARTPTSS